MTHRNSIRSYRSDRGIKRTLLAVVFCFACEETTTSSRSRSKSKTAAMEIHEEQNIQIDISQDNVLKIGQTSVRIPSNAIQSSNSANYAVRLRRVGTPTDLDSTSASVLDAGKEIVEVLMTDVETGQMIDTDRVLEPIIVTQNIESDSDDLAMLAVLPPLENAGLRLTETLSYDGASIYAIRKPNLKTTKTSSGLFAASAGLKASAFLIASFPAAVVPSEIEELDNDNIVVSKRGSGSTSTSTATSSTGTSSTAGTTSSTGGSTSGTGGTDSGGGGSANLALRYVSILGEKDNKLGSNTSSTNGPGYRSFNFINESSAGETARAVHITDSGRILLAGNGTVALPKVKIMALDEYGVLDTSFGNSGIVSYGEGGSDGFVPVAMVEDSQGRILIALSHFSPSVQEAQIVRFNANGSLDSQFGSNGTVSYGVGATTPTTAAKDLITNDNGTIFLAVSATDGIRRGHTVVFNSNGTQLSDINGSGVDYFQHASLSAHANGFCRNQDGAVFVVGAYSTGLNMDIGLAKFSPAGAIDTSFGSSGIFTKAYNIGDSDWDEGVSCAVASDGGIYVLARTGENNHANLMVFKLLPSGTGLDSSFGMGSGSYDAPFVGSLGNPIEIALEETGVFYILANEGSGYQVQALTADGEGIFKFNSGNNKAMELWNTGCQDEMAKAMAIDAMGRLVMVGSCLDNLTGKNVSTIYRIR
jgi:uncharacterized delta-60 repeat protein